MKIRILLLTIIFALIIIDSAFACICGIKTYDELQKSGVENSEYIFIAEVSERDSNTETYEVEVIELLKGKLNKKKIKGKYTNSCSIVPSRGMWIIYGNIENGYLKISECSPSRSFHEPEIISVQEYNLSFPTRNEYNLKKEEKVNWNLEFQKEFLELRMQALKDLQLEIINLRRNKILSIPNYK